MLLLFNKHAQNICRRQSGTPNRRRFDIAVNIINANNFDLLKRRTYPPYIFHFPTLLMHIVVFNFGLIC